MSDFELSKLVGGTADVEVYIRDADGTHLAAFQEAGWRVGFRLARDDGSWNLMEFHAQPIAPSRNAEDIRRLPLGRLLARARRGITRAEELQRQRSPRMEQNSMLAAFDGKGGKRKIPAAAYANLAFVYAGLVSAGERSPAKVIAEQYGGSPQVWANRILRTRDMGLLSPGEPGRASGTVTDRAFELIWSDEEDDSSSGEEPDPAASRERRA